jgi:uncharacterized protein (TIGR03437 family)
MKHATIAAASAAIPITLWAFSTGPNPGLTGAPVDNNGATCTQCHRPGADTAGGSLRIESAPYRPGQPQTVRVIVSHPAAERWGFQLTARMASDETRKAGTFRLVPGGPIRIRCGLAGRDATPTEGCGNDVEFASHGGNPDSTFGGVNGTKVFEVEWTPPQDASAGDIVFYAAGNAANSSGNNLGDRVYNARSVIEREPACEFSVRPQVRGIGNAATSAAAITFNTMVSIYGSDFVPATATRPLRGSDIRGGRVPTELGCIAVEIAGQRVPVTHVQRDQINVETPTIAQTGPVPVRILVNPGTARETAVDAGTVNIQTFGPALFTFNGTSVAAQHLDFSIAADPAVVPGGRPVRAGDVVMLYATGLGETLPSTWQAGEIVEGEYRTRFPVRVTIGGTTVPESDVLFAGLSPGSISALYQINVRTPATAPAGNVPVSISVGGMTSPPGTTIPIQR